MKKRTFIIAVSMLMLLLVSCFPESENPLSDPHDFAADSRLEGIWHGRSLLSSQGIDYLHFVPRGESLMDLDLVVYRYEGKPGDPLGWGRYRVFWTRIEGTQYLNVRGIAAGSVRHGVGKNEQSSYFIFKYEITEDENLTIWAMSEEVLTRDIKEGKVAGAGCCSITDSSVNLQDYIRHSGDLFSVRFGVYRRILSKVPAKKTAERP